MIYDKTNQFTIPFMFLITMTTISYQKTMTTIINEREREREYSGSFEGRPDSGKSPMIFHLYLTNSIYNILPLQCPFVYFWMKCQFDHLYG